jgi:hypothetical protein
MGNPTASRKPRNDPNSAHANVAGQSHNQFRNRIAPTISLQIPTYWTPEQAFAVFELIDDLRDAIWQCYNIQLIDEFRDRLKPDLVNCTENEPDDPGLLTFKKTPTRNSEAANGLPHLHCEPSAVHPRIHATANTGSPRHGHRPRPL